MKTRTLQEIFNVVIDKGYYKEFGVRGSSFMCNALFGAYCADVITRKEHDKALDAIGNYIDKYTSDITLKSALINLNRPYNFSDRLAIYRNWKNRPRTKLKLRKDN